MNAENVNLVSVASGRVPSAIGKTCTQCDIFKPLEEFSPAKLGKLGRRSNCKKCANKKAAEYYKNNPEKVKESVKKSRNKHLEKRRAGAKAWREKNPEKQRELSERWIRNNPDKVREGNQRRGAKYRDSHREQIRERCKHYSAEYRRKNPQKVKEAQAQWRSDNQAYDRERRLKYFFDLPIGSYPEMLARQNGGCAICGRAEETCGTSLSVDHCHTTGVVRGLLCRDCNLGLGAFQDCTQTLRSAEDYVKAPPGIPPTVFIDDTNRTKAQRARGRALMDKFGMSLEQYEAALESQKHSCCICRRHKSEYAKALAVDHCHSSGINRGLLCVKCNTGLGLFKDNATSLLGRAIAYLESYDLSEKEAA